MTKADIPPTTSLPLAGADVINATTRRTLFGAAVLALGATVPVIAATVAATNPDAELIRICAEHVVNLRAVNTSPYQEGSAEGDALWDAYDLTRDAIDAAKPQTIAGMQAIARAAKVEATHRDGTEAPEGTMAVSWGWNLMDALLRLNGGAA